jgi:hypothetical protein
MVKPSKEDLIVEISALLEIPAMKVSTGSTEPKELFIAISDVLGLSVSSKLTKPEMAQQIVEFAGGVWTTDCESSGGTVTHLGLERVRDAVSFFTKRETGGGGAK